MRKPSAAITSAVPVHRATTAGLRPSCAPFQTRFASLVAVVAGQQQLAAERVAQLLHRRLAEHR